MYNSDEAKYKMKNSCQMSLDVDTTLLTRYFFLDLFLSAYCSKNKPTIHSNANRHET